MSNEPNKPIEAQELTEKELECVEGGMKVSRVLGGVMMLGTIAVLVPAVSVIK